VTCQERKTRTSLTGPACFVSGFVASLVVPPDWIVALPYYKILLRIYLSPFYLIPKFADLPVNIITLGFSQYMGGEA
jgi:hypothetical protein